MSGGRETRFDWRDGNGDSTPISRFLGAEVESLMTPGGWAEKAFGPMVDAMMREQQPAATFEAEHQGLIVQLLRPGADLHAIVGQFHDLADRYPRMARRRLNLARMDAELAAQTLTPSDFLSPAWPDDRMLCTCGSGWFTVQAVKFGTDRKISEYVHPVTCAECGQRVNPEIRP